MRNPIIIQGGMGVGVSNWSLARAVSKIGQLGVVSSTALDMVMARRLQMGDPDGNIRKALEHFPLQDWVEEALKQYFIEGGKPSHQPFKTIPLHSLDSAKGLLRLTILANFAEVFLAKDGHGGIIGINLLEKIQCPTLPSLMGAMLAGVDFVLMGAGIPKSIPGILDQLAEGKPVEMKLDVQGFKEGDHFTLKLDSRNLGLAEKKLKRPKFVPIISSSTLAITLVHKSNGRVDGFVVEGSTAGGHNAPPRGNFQLNERGEPIYGPKDDPAIDKIRKLGLPFWLAGSFGDPSKVEKAFRFGAAGVQVGTAFAFCEESGIEPSLKRRIIEKSLSGQADVYTDPLASPTGFPFKVFRMENSLSEPEAYRQRERVCDLGYLRQAYRKDDGNLGYRCPGEPIAQYLAKGGRETETVGRKCLCNGLMATIGLGQRQSNEYEEKAIITAGNDVLYLDRLLKPGQFSYSASDVVKFLLEKISPKFCNEL